MKAKESKAATRVRRLALNRRARERRHAQEQAKKNASLTRWTPREDRVSNEDVRLEATSPPRKSSQRILRWKVCEAQRHVGRVAITQEGSENGIRIGSIDIHISKPDRGRGIGAIAYRLACEASTLDKVYARMRKSNHASAKAAKAAGFQPVEVVDSTQLLLVWKRLTGDHLLNDRRTGGRPVLPRP